MLPRLGQGAWFWAGSSCPTGAKAAPDSALPSNSGCDIKINPTQHRYFCFISRSHRGPACLATRTATRDAGGGGASRASDTSAPSVSSTAWLACFSCRGCPDRRRESRPLLHVAQGGERGPEASFCLSKMRPIFQQISIQVFVIIPVLYNKLQDGLLNAAGVGILLLKVLSVDIPLPLCLDSRDTSLPW